MTTRTQRWLSSLIPDTPLARKLSLQSILFAIGEGVFLTGSAVFFTQIVGLSAAQVGLGQTVAGVVSFFFAVPLGKLADRIGPKRMWCLGSFGGAALYLMWPLISGFPQFLAMMIVLEVVGTAGGVWAPAAYTFLAMEWGTPGWLTIAALVVAATLCIGQTSRSAQRYLAAAPARAAA